MTRLSARARRKVADDAATAAPETEISARTEDCAAEENIAVGEPAAGATAPSPADSVDTPTAVKFDPRSRFGAWLNRPLTSFHLIVSVTALLTTLGLIMVLSASGVRSYGADGSAWVIFDKQVVWTVVGLIAFYISLRTPVRVIRRLAFPAYAFTIILLVLVLIPGIGNLANGSRKWFVVAGLSMQPSELAKIAFAIWGAHLLATRRLERASLREMLVPLVPGALIALVLIVAQPDLGQTVSMGIILLALLWYAGLPLKVFVSSLSAVVVAGAVLAMSAGYRSDRVRSWLDPDNDPQDTGYQARQAKFALAHGGVFGDGLGQGVAKWNYLPNAHNDFIFAIVGEELGLIGALGLLGLFGLFAYTGMRIARRSADPFLRLLTATTTMWVLGQAFINIGYVIGLLPVTGLQLPLISAGGTSTAAVLFMIGIMANAARHEPEAVAVLRTGRSDKMNRLLRLAPPEPYVPSKLDAFRNRKAGRGVELKAPEERKAKAIPQSKPDGARRRSSTAATVHARPRQPAMPRLDDRSVPRSGHHVTAKRHDRQGTTVRQGRRPGAVKGQRYG